MSAAEEPIDVSIAQDGGIMKTIIRAAPEGIDDTPPPGYEVSAHYTGKQLTDCQCDFSP